MTTRKAAYMTSRVERGGRGWGRELGASNEHKAPSFVLKAVTQIPSAACVSVAAPCSGGPRLPERKSRLWVSLVTGQLIRAMWCLSEAVTGEVGGGWRRVGGRLQGT